MCGEKGGTEVGGLERKKEGGRWVLPREGRREGGGGIERRKEGGRWWS